MFSVIFEKKNMSTRSKMMLDRLVKASTES